MRPGSRGSPPHGLTAGHMGFVAVAGPSIETTGVLKIDPSDASRSVNMARIADAALDLMEHLQAKQSCWPSDTWLGTMASARPGCERSAERTRHGSDV